MMGMGINMENRERKIEMYHNFKEVLENKKNPFFHITVENGEYRTENGESYYAAKLPDETFSYDVSNNKVLANLDEFGTVKLISFYRSHYTADDIPGVWVCKDFGQAGPFYYGLEIGGREISFKSGEVKAQSDLLDNLFPRAVFTGDTYKASILAYAPVSADGRVRLRAMVYGIYIENIGEDCLEGKVVLPDYSPGGNYFTLPDVSGTTLECLTEGKKVPFSLKKGKGVWIPTVLYGPGENEDLKEISGKGTLYWFNQTAAYFRNILGRLRMPEDEMTAYLFERAVYQGLSSVGMNREGKVCGSNWGTFPTTKQIWMKDMYYSYLPLCMLYPDYFKQGMLWFLENGIRPKGARYEGGVYHSLSNSLTSVLMGTIYYEKTGDKDFFLQERTQVYPQFQKILEEVLALQGEECSLIPTVWISDALALGKYHTGSNVCAWKAFEGMARIAGEVYGDQLQAGKYRDMAKAIYADIEKYMVIDTAAGRQYLEGIGGLAEEERRTYPLSNYDVEYVDQAKVFYPDIIEGGQVNLVMHDGEESDTTLMPFYGYKPYDDEIIRNYSKFTTSTLNPTWGTQCRGIKWGHESGATFPGYTTAFIGVVDEETMNGERGYLRELKRLADLDGSWWWWPYKVNTETKDVVRLNCCGKCGWASGVFAATMITQILGITYDGARSKLTFRPFSPGSGFEWQDAPAGRGKFDFSYKAGEAGKSVSVINKSGFTVETEIEIITEGNPICGFSGEEMDYREGAFLNKRTVKVMGILRPEEKIEILA